MGSAAGGGAHSIFKVTPSKIESNLKCGLSDQFVLTDEEMAEIATIDKKINGSLRVKFSYGKRHRDGKYCGT